MDGDAGNSDGGKRNEAGRDETTKPLVQQQHQIFPGNKAIEFALSVQPLAKQVWDLSEPVWHRSRGEEIDKNLKALAGETSGGSFEGRPRNQKKSAHRIAELGGDDNPGEASCNPADRNAMAIPLADPAAGRVAAADHYVEVLRLDGAEHLRQHRFVVLQVGIDDRQIRCAAREHAFDDRGSQAAAADALDAADARI